MHTRRTTPRRRHHYVRLTFRIAFISLTISNSHAAEKTPNFPFGKQHQEYRGGTLTPSGYTAVELNRHTTDYYDVWKKRWLSVDPRGNGWRVKYEKRSEKELSATHGFGMRIVAAMAGYDPEAKTIYDGLWTFRKAHPTDGDDRLMDWHLANNSFGNSSSFDGDADIAFSLLMAHAQWGSDGDVDYLKEARNVISGIKELTIGPESRLPVPGSWITLRSDARFSQWVTRPSDFMPVSFRAFGKATNDEEFWDSVVDAVQSVCLEIQTNESPETGLLPDYVALIAPDREAWSAGPGFLHGIRDGDFWHFACRTPWRLGDDVILNHDPLSRSPIQKITTWLRESTQNDATKVTSGYTLYGEALTNRQSHLFLAPLTVAAMCDSGAGAQKWLDDLYELIYERHVTYNCVADALTLQAMITISGNNWDPTRMTAEGSD